MNIKLIEMTPEDVGFYIEFLVMNDTYAGILDYDQIEDLELQLTNIIKQLQDYRLKQEEKA